MNRTGFENGQRVVVDTDSPIDRIEPPPLPEDQDEREAMMAGIRWTIERLSGPMLITKMLALRYLLRLERRSLRELGAPYGLSKSAINKYVAQFSNAFGIPRLREGLRADYAERQREVWRKRKAAKQITANREPVSSKA
jgi:hypothetical protein